MDSGKSRTGDASQRGSKTVQAALLALSLLLLAPREGSSVDHDLWTWIDPNDFEASVDTKGMWGDVVDITPQDHQHNPVHGVLLADEGEGRIVMWRNKVLMFYDLSPGGGYEETSIPIGRYDHHPFCASMTPLPSGDILVSGGHRVVPANGCCGCDEEDGDEIPAPPYASILRPGWPVNSDILDRITDMPDTVLGSFPADSSRWYPTGLLLPDNNVLVVGGHRWNDVNGNCEVNEGADGFPNNRTWITLDPISETWTIAPNPMITPADSTWPHELRTGDDYPRFYVLPEGLFFTGWNGRVGFGGVSDKFSRYWLWEPDYPWAWNEGAYLSPEKVTGHSGGCAVPLTLRDPYDAEQKVLIAGGGNGTDVTEIIDLGASTPEWDEVDSMLHGRFELDLVLLPNGQLFAVGGAADENFDTQVFECEIYDPGADSWAAADTLAKARLYHSFAFLLPDGRVLASGNEGGSDYGNTPEGFTYEIYYPPYLFDGTTAYADRPEISTVEAPIQYGRDFVVTTPQGEAANVDSVCIMRPSAVTHAFDHTQRRIVLAFSEEDSSTISVTAPPDSMVAPPGDYMIFLIEDDVPSVGRFVTVGSDFYVASGDSVTWSGTVKLHDDFTVEPGGILKILPGTQVLAKANHRRDAGGSSLVELINKGTLIADGTNGNEITFSSYDGLGNEGEWGGIRIDMTGCNATGYGYMACDETASITHAEIKKASHGISISNYCAPTIDSVSFNQITDSLHIYLDSTDVYVARYHWNVPGVCTPDTEHWLIEEPVEWRLAPGTNVVASNGQLQDGYPGQTDRVDLVVQGRIDALGADGDLIFFRPETANDGTADDWGGLMLDSDRQNTLEYVDIGHAQNPLFIGYADSLTAVRHSRIHHFVDEGIWAYGSGEEGGVIALNRIERGSGLNLAKGLTGVRIDGATEARVHTNVVDISGNLQGPTSAAVDVYFGKNLCQSSSSSPGDSVVIQKNTIKGPGQGEGGTNGRVGIKLYWVCGSEYRKIFLDENYVNAFKTSGLEFNQTSNVQVSCNTVFDCTRSVDLYRDSEPTGNSVRFKKNWLEVKDGIEQVVRTDDLDKTKLGPSSSTRGDNALIALETNVNFIQDDDPDGGSLDARYNYWYLWETNPDTLNLIGDDEFNAAQILNRISPDSTNVNVSFYFTADSVKTYCFADSAPARIGGSGRSVAKLEEIRAVDSPHEDIGIPSETYFRLASRHPARGPIQFEIGVSEEGKGGYEIDVFDIRGRRVKKLVNSVLEPGYHRVMWSRRDSGGARVSAGVYFLRITGPGLERTEKLVILD